MAGSERQPVPQTLGGIERDVEDEEEFLARGAREDRPLTCDGFFPDQGLLRVLPVEYVGKKELPLSSEVSELGAFRLATEDYGLSCGGYIGLWMCDLERRDSGASVGSTADDKDYPRVELSILRRNLDRVPNGVYFSCEVPDGQEDAWIRILSQSKLIRTVDYAPAQWASASDDIYIPRLTVPSSEGIVPSVVAEGRIEMLLDLVRRFYVPRGSLQVVKQTPLRFRLIVELRGEVIPARGYWERLEIDVIVVPQEDSSTVVVVIDGYVASGSGSRPPPLGRYTDMSEDYQQELDLHLARLTATIRSGAQETR